VSDLAGDDAFDLTMAVAEGALDAEGITERRLLLPVGAP
jgi:hypothetical protein